MFIMLILQKKRKFVSNLNELLLFYSILFYQICETMATKRLLVWHNKQSNNNINNNNNNINNNTNDSMEAPVAVHAWLEQGSNISSALLQPKFCWQEVNYKENLDKSSLLRKTFSFHTVELLDISKIIPLDRCYVDRDMLPFVKNNTSFIIEAFGGSMSMVFEARDEEERDDIVNGLKMAVARLGSKIIIGDSSVLDEFFSPLGSVPGTIPSIALQK